MTITVHTVSWSAGKRDVVRYFFCRDTAIAYARVIKEAGYIAALFSGAMTFDQLHKAVKFHPVDQHCRETPCSMGCNFAAFGEYPC